MTKAQKIHARITNREFSYGESIAMIMEESGRAIRGTSSSGSSFDEDFVFPDNSVIRVTNNGVSLLEFLSE